MSGAAGNGLGTTINYLRKNKTSGAAGSGLSATAKYFDAQRAPPRATAWA
jgi:hypothetical protein